MTLLQPVKSLPLRPQAGIDTSKLHLGRPPAERRTHVAKYSTLPQCPGSRKSVLIPVDNPWMTTVMILDDWLRPRQSGKQKSPFGMFSILMGLSLCQPLKNTTLFAHWWYCSTPAVTSELEPVQERTGRIFCQSFCESRTSLLAVVAVLGWGGTEQPNKSPTSLRGALPRCHHRC